MADEPKLVPYCVYSDEIKYSHDCGNCKFAKFMKVFGYDLNINNCFVDCTEEIKAETDTLFGYFLEHTFTNSQGAVLFTGNTPEVQKRMLRS